MLGRRPYYGRNRREIRDEIMGHQVQVKKHEIPEDWSMESADFVNRLLQRKQTSRLGYMDSGEIREHPWLRQYPWHKLIRQDYPAPFEPTYHVSDSHQKHEQAGNREVILQYEMLLREPQVQSNQLIMQSSSKTTTAIFDIVPNFDYIILSSIDNFILQCIVYFILQ